MLWTFWKCIGNILSKKTVFPQECSWLQGLHSPLVHFSSRGWKAQGSQRPPFISICGYWGDTGRGQIQGCLTPSGTQLCYQNNNILYFCFYLFLMGKCISNYDRCGNEKEEMINWKKKSLKYFCLHFFCLCIYCLGNHY